MSTDELLHILALKFVPGVGDVNGKQLISYCGSATAVFKEKKGALTKIPGIGDKTIGSILNGSPFKLSDQIIENCKKYDFQIIPYYSSNYPRKLKLINDSPLVLFYKGRGTLNIQKTVSVVGTRKATNYGREITEKIINELKSHDALMVSGLAYGIDIIAHRQALKMDLPTVGVLAGGLDKIYPALHKKSAEEMLENGGILSEQYPGVVPEAHFFPARNRIIAGMSDATIVVEAAKKGGALITANIAYSYDREVFAVPGNLEHKYSEGCNALIRSQQATIFTGVRDLEYLLGWEKGQAKSLKEKPLPEELNDQERKLVAVMKEFKSGILLDELSWKSQTTINETVSLLLSLEFAGLVKSLPGKKYKLC